MLPFKPHRLFNNQQWQDCYVSWLTSVYEDNSRSQATAKGYNLYCHCFFADPAKKPDQYTSDDVRSFINTPTKRGKAPTANTRNTRLTTLSSFYGYASRYQISFRGKMRPLLKEVSPCADIKQIESPDVERDMTEEEMRRFMAAIPRDTVIGKRDRTLFLGYLHTSRRRNEIVNLRWRDLEQIEDDRWAYRWKGKGRMGRDSAELPSPVVAALQEYLIADGRWGHMQPGDPIFPGRKPGEPICSRTVNYAFWKYSQIAELPASLCPHAIRHLAAWERNEANGGKLLDTAKFLGHKSVAATERYLKRPRQKPLADPVAAKITAKYSDL